MAQANWTNTGSPYTLEGASKNRDQFRREQLLFNEMKESIP